MINTFLKLGTGFILLTLCYILSLIMQYEAKTYAELKDEDIHPERVRNFYKKAVSMLSQGRLHASISHYGVGAFCDQDFKPNDVAMEIPGNYSISSFDDVFPYFDELNYIIEAYIKQGYATENDLNEVRMILNINWIKFMDTSNRFFRIFFKNLPKYRESLLSWEVQEKNILQKMTSDPIIGKDLLYLNTTVRDFLIEDIKRYLRKKDPSLPMQLLADWKVEEAMNIIYTRTLPISLKGWKLIRNNITDLHENDINYWGFILIPGADAINYEKLKPEHPDTDLSQVKFEKGRILIKAGRNFKTGEEFTINYDVSETVFGIFRKYGFVPIEAIVNNMVFRYDGVDMSTAPRAGRLVCLALGACEGSDKDTHFKVSKFTNKFDLAHLTIERLNFWIGPPFVEEKMFDIYNMIVRHQHSNVTEAIALSKFAHSFYGNLLYSQNFKTDISSLISMYEQNEKQVPVSKNLKDHFFNKVKITKDSVEIRERFREIIKFCLVNHHIVALNTKESIKMMNTTLDNLFEELKKDILEQTS